MIGAGAAGLMAAIAAARQDSSKTLKILLLDTRPKIGAKILISGGTRCNVTNRRVTPSDYYGGPSHFVKHILEAFSPDQTRNFFEEIGVPLVLEVTGKYFPTTHSGKTVLEALMKECARLGVILKTECRITQIKKEGDRFHLKGDGVDSTSRRVVLATGGLSYPETGSDGTGYKIAQSLGHTLVPTAAALTPLLCQDEDWQSLSGIALEAALYFYENGKKKEESRSALLFTHFGFSGPSALDISRFWARSSADKHPEIFARFLPEENEETLKKILDAQAKAASGQRVKRFLMERFAFPERFVEIIIKKSGVDETRSVAKLLAPQKSALIRYLMNCPLPITGVYGYKKAEVTSGGIPVSEVKNATMESKRTPGLYFAGEILDVDGRIGGFNFQWAWSTGTVAGRSAVKSLAA